MRIEDKIIQLKRAITQAEQERLTARAELSVQMKRLKDEFGLSSTEAAEKLLIKWQRDLKEQEDEINEGLTKIEGVMDESTG